MASGKELVAKINSGVMKTSRAQDVRKDTEKMMKTYANWEEFLMPAPLSVALLGQLVCVSAKKDFAVNHGMKDKKFKYIEYPESFRACLMQVCNTGWVAFNMAHKNMDQIRLYSLNIPTDIGTVVKTLMQEDDAIVTALLPGQLRHIEHTANECYTLASAVEDKFMDVINLISELMEAFTCSTKLYNDSVKEAEAAMREAELMRKSAEDARRVSQQNYEQMEKQMKEAQEAYKDAMKAMPSGWSLLGLEIVDGLRNIVTMIPNAVKQLSSGLSQNKLQGGQDDELSENDDEGATVAILSKAQQLHLASHALAGFVSESGQIKKKDLYDNMENKFMSDFSKFIFLRLKREVKAEKTCRAKQSFLSLCNIGIKICEDLESVIKTPQSQKAKGLPKRIKSLCKKSEALSIAASMKSRRPPLNCKGPHMAKASEKVQCTDSIVQTHVNLATFKVEQAKAQLHHTDEEVRIRFEEMTRRNKELDEILIKISRCNVEKIDYEETLEVLSEGLKALGQVKEQWSKLVQFFQMISNLIKTCLNQNLNKFVMDCKSIPQIEGYTHSAYVKDLIYQQAFQASNVSSLVNMISETYVTVSRKHLMDRVSALGTLMSLKPSDQEFNLTRMRLMEGCKQSKAEIEALVSKNMKEFSDSVEERIATIDRNLKPALPSSSGERVKEIEESYRKEPDILIRELSEEDMDQFC
ncbi:hypothetical protein Z043_106524 [Scleropages formosus]|uniref:Uncharacterized protein n=1 Tax=Scleropages formosus TaxID=113540 RepID=A0A0P7UJ39_SCLFO|nr:uncharacterized protein LOC108930391 [Scleropages formosus]KPP74328.1 hypothetical protein Z043_106524 [Scleropages formosus]